MDYPSALVDLNQWMVTRGDSKAPVSAHTGILANDQDPGNWASFAEAHHLLVRGQVEHIGVVLQPQNRIVCIDVDNHADNPPTDEELRNQELVIQTFAPHTYTEMSNSYSEQHPCYHIFTEGVISRDLNKHKLQLIQNRFVIVTGMGVSLDQIANGKDKELEELFFALGGGGPLDTPYDDAPILETSGAIYDRMRNSSDPKWAWMFNRFQEPQGRSEDDMVLAGWIGCFTKNKSQLVEVFNMFPYSQRYKSDGTKLTDYHIGLVADKVLKSKQGQIQELKEFKASVGPLTNVVPTVVEPVAKFIPSLPSHGLIREIAEFTYAASQRPVPEISLMTAIAMFCGIVGRAYISPTRTGLALYLLSIANTGVGKETASKTISRLVKTVMHDKRNLVADKIIGPEMVSGPGLRKALAEESQSFVLMLYEFGQLLATLRNAKEGTREKETLRTLLDIYSKNNPDDMLKKTAHAVKDSKVKEVHFPAMTIMAETEPDGFFNMLDEGMVSSGLLPRFLIMQYEGERSARNKNAQYVVPNEVTIAKLDTLINFCEERQKLNDPMAVRWTADAEQMLEEFNDMADAKMRGRPDTFRHIWNRAYENAIRYSSALAVSKDFFQPCIDVEDAELAIALVKNSCMLLDGRFAQGDVGEGDSRQVADALRCLREYCDTPFDKIPKSYGAKASEHAKRMINETWWQRKIGNLPSFKKNKMMDSSKKVQDYLRRRGALIDVTPATKQSYGLNGTLYLINREELD